MTDRAKSKTKTSRASSTKSKASKAKPPGSASPGATRVRKHRERMKALGLKPVLLWLPDVNSPEFKAEVAEAIAAIHASEDEKLILKELEAAFEDIEGWI